MTAPIAGDRFKTVCHSPGLICLGCDHYFGKAARCSYADQYPKERHDKPLRIAAPRDVELANLRQRVKRQRAEIRRLNQSASFWNGHRFATAKTLEATLRGKMIAAFGVEAVRQAESGKK